MKHYLKHITIIIVIATLLIPLENFIEASLSNSTKRIIYDEYGAPMTDYGYQYGVYIGKVWNPLTVAEYAINYFNMYNATHDEQFKLKFLHCVNILLNLSEDRGDYLVFLYNFPWPYPKYQINGSWTSCMSQSAGIVALALAYKVTSNITYLRIANKALKAFEIPVEEGGLAYKVDDGLWYEEYAYPRSKVRPYVLNGFMYSLIRLYEYWKLTGNEKALELFNKGIRALKLMIHKFDLGYWTAYDLLGTIARLPKHELHIRFSKKLYEITGDKIFEKYYEKWSNYIFTPMVLRS